MILEFLDKSQIEIIAIFGSPKLVMGVMRDTLNIEVSPSSISFEDLKSHFKDNPKTGTLYTYGETTDETGNIVTGKITIGEGYNIFVSITDENRKAPSPPGRLVPDKIEEVYVVSIAQMTYQEHLLNTMGFVTPDGESKKTTE